MRALVVLRLSFALGSGVALLGSPAPAAAQSAADKATARQLATEGIKLFQAGDARGALEKLERAQALYDAPVHLLYIARAQEKLGKLVEAAETYRALLRAELAPGAPPAFKEAVASAKPELAALEPRIPSLVLEVTPTPAGLEVTLDGEKVNVAALGVARPVNPGDHVLRATAPGYLPAEGKVTLGAGEKRTHALKLAVDPQASTAGAAGAAASEGAGGAAGASSPRPAPPEEEPKDGLGFELGLRLGGFVPTGSIAVERDAAGVETEQRVSDYAEPGGGAEFYGGIRLFRYFGARLVLQAANLTPGPRFANGFDVPLLGTIDITSPNVSLTSVGGVLVIGTGRGRTGGFGELGVMSETWAAAGTGELVTILGTVRCEITYTLRATTVRIGGGAIFPVADWLQISPFANVASGSFRDAEVAFSACNAGNPEGSKVSYPEADRRTHTTITLGVGGEWVFGDG